MLINLFGFISNVFSFIMFVPQAKTTYEMSKNNSNLKGLSLWLILISLSNAILWVVYALITEAYWAGTPSIVNIPLTSWILFLKLKAMRKQVQE